MEEIFPEIFEKKIGYETDILPKMFHTGFFLRNFEKNLLHGQKYFIIESPCILTVCTYILRHV